MITLKFIKKNLFGLDLTPIFECQVADQGLFFHRNEEVVIHGKNYMIDHVVHTKLLSEVEYHVRQV